MYVMIFDYISRQFAQSSPPKFECCKCNSFTNGCNLFRFLVINMEYFTNESVSHVVSTFNESSWSRYFSESLSIKYVRCCEKLTEGWFSVLPRTNKLL